MRRVRDLRELRWGRSTRMLAVIGAVVVVVTFVACVGILVVATVVGSLLANQGGATTPVAAPQTAAVRSTDLPLPTAPPPTPEPLETEDAATTSNVPQPTVTVPLSETPEIVETVQPVVGLLQPMGESDPSVSLEFTPTSQLTLSSVIFVENVGQFGADTRFQVRSAAGGGVWLAPDAIWVTLLAQAAGGLGLGAELEAGASLSGTAEVETQGSTAQGVSLRLSFVGSNPNPELVAFDRLDTQVSYFHGNDPANWHTGVPVWGGVRYLQLYPGVDLELTSEEGQYIQRLVVHPGADLSAVRLRIEGSDALALEPLPLSTDGQEVGEAGLDTANPADPSSQERFLRLSTILGDLSLPLFQVVAAADFSLPMPTLPIPRLADGEQVVENPFSMPGMGSLEPSSERFRPVYSTLLERGGNAGSHAIAVDGTGNAYVTGYTYLQSSFATAGPFETGSTGSYDAFVVKMNAAGTVFAYAAVVGGSGDEIGSAIAVDGDGSAYVAGLTDSPDLPTTAGAFDTNYHAGYDAFAVKLVPAGSELAYATYLGGNGDDWGRAIAADGTGSAYVTGSTGSTDFPATIGAWDPRPDGQDAFVVKVNAAGTGLAYATFLGGSGVDEGQAIAVDSSGSAYVAGSTESFDFPATAGAFDASPNGAEDAFVARVNEAGTELVYATLLGGKDADYGRALAVDSSGSAYLVGSTRSADFPTTPWAFDAGYDGGYDAFVVKVDAAGSKLDYATLLGGSEDDWGQAVAVDDTGNAYVSGSSQTFPLPEAAEASDTSHAGGYNGFVVRMNELGTGLAYATSLGGGGEDLVQALAVDGMGSVYVAGMSKDSDLRAPAQGLGTGSPGLWDVFVSKLAVGTPFLDLPVSYSNFAQSALGNVGDRGPGRVNSWFDHNYPNHTRNQKLVRWDGLGAAFTASSLPRIGESWYDGHGGTDFRRDGRDDPIFAAAPGMVVDTVSRCRVGDPSCGNYFGNRVWIDHGNGYATVYAHLKTVYVSTGTVITDPVSLPLGIMGNTGRSLGTHLHFGLYFDGNGDRRWTSDEVVDPYGWAGSGSDPWNGTSWYLWKHPLWTRQLVGSDAEDGVLRSPSELVTVTIPAEAVPWLVQVELWDMPPGAGPLPNWHSTGRAFWLKGERLDAEGEEGDLTFAQPITLSVAYRQQDMLHLDPSRLTLYRWDAGRKAWNSVPSRVDVDQRQVVAQTTDLGRFELHAPLLCPADSLEPDDHYGAAQVITTEGVTVSRVFDVREDVDWFRFEAQAGRIYRAQVDHLATGVGALVRLYDADSVAPLASGRSSEGSGVSALTWKAPADGAYLVQVSQMPDSARGCQATYQFSLKQVVVPEVIAVTGPTAGILQASYVFTATVSPAQATQPITYIWQITGQLPVTHTGKLSDTLAFAWDAAGEYGIVVTATNAGGTIASTHSIRIQPPIEAAFSASSTKGEAPLKVAFENTSSGEYTKSLWDFGDGTTSRSKDPAHVYETPGVYAVTLTVSGPAGSDTETKVDYITVEERHAPVEPRYKVYLPFVVR